MGFIFTNLNHIVLAVWVVFFAVVVLRTVRPTLVFQVGYKWLIVGAVSIRLLYGVIATWGQYAVWSSGSELTRTLAATPLSPDVPLPVFLGWLRPLFAGEHGYFMFYALTHFFLSTFAVIVILGLFYLFLVVRRRSHPVNFREEDVSIVIIAFLVSGWPGAIVLLPVGFLCAVFLSIGAKLFYGIERTPLSFGFLLGVPVAFFFDEPILSALSLYSLLKL